MRRLNLLMVDPPYSGWREALLILTSFESLIFPDSMTGKVGLSYFEKNTPYANFTPIDANQSVHQKEALFPRKRSVGKF